MIIQWEHHLPEGCILSVMFCVCFLSNVDHSVMLLWLCIWQCVCICLLFFSLFFLKYIYNCATLSAAWKMTSIAGGSEIFWEKKKVLFIKVHMQSSFYTFLFTSQFLFLALHGYWIRLLSTPLVSHLPCSWLPPGGIFYWASFIWK